MTETKNTSTSIKPDSSNNRRDSVTTVIKKRYTRMKHYVNQFMVDNRIYENIDEAAKYLMSHPILLTICIGITATLIIPVLLFIVFAIINVAFVFTGFIVVVVAVLTVGGTVLCSLMFSFIMTIVIIGICLVFTWSLSCYILSVMRNFKVVPCN